MYLLVLYTKSRFSERKKKDEFQNDTAIGNMRCLLYIKIVPHEGSTEMLLLVGICSNGKLRVRTIRLLHYIC